MKLIAIWAESQNGVIGSNGKIPWKNPEDMKHFKETTIGHPVIMGRTTFESLGNKNIAQSSHIVITSRPQLMAEGFDKIKLFKTPEACLEYLEKEGYKKAFVIGGLQTYNAFESHLTEANVTTIENEYDGDVSAPTVPANMYLHTTTTRPATENSDARTIRVYKRQ